MCSSGVWISIIPFARLRQDSPRALKTFASAPPPESAYLGFPKPQAVSASAARRTTESLSRKRYPGKLGRTSLSTSQSAELAAYAAVSSISRARARSPCARPASAPPPGTSTARHDVPRRPARDHADVGARLLVDPCRAGSLRSRAAAATAERPSSGAMPACAARPSGESRGGDRAASRGRSRRSPRTGRTRTPSRRRASSSRTPLHRAARSPPAA